MQAMIEAAGFDVLKWDDVTSLKEESAGPRPVQTIQKLVMGKALLAKIMHVGQLNDAEKRLIMIQAVFERIEKGEVIEQISKIHG